MAIADRALGDNRDALIEARLESYKRLAAVFHDVLSEQHLGDLLERVADTLAELIPYDTLTVYQTHETEPILLPVLARDKWADEIMNDQVEMGEGLTGWAVENRMPMWSNQAHLDPRMVVIPGTPSDEAEAVIIVPLVARGQLQGALNIYRLESGVFDEEDFELAKRFGDAVAIALDNARGRAQLEQLAHTDSLTGLYNHRFFYERLRAELTRASRIHDSVTVLMLDIDDFKKLNDVYWARGRGSGAGEHRRGPHRHGESLRCRVQARWRRVHHHHALLRSGRRARIHFPPDGTFVANGIRPCRSRFNVGWCGSGPGAHDESS